MSVGQCPSRVSLSRAVGEEMPDGLAQHLMTCPRCQAAWERERRLVDHLQKMPRSRVTPEKTEQLLGELLVRAAPRKPLRTRPARGRLIGVAAAAVLAFVGGALFWGWGGFESPAVPSPDPQVAASPAAVPYRASVHASEGAVFDVISPQPDEIVRVFDGVVTFTVDELLQGERFRVVTGDAEIEVVGTVFEVLVEADKLQLVRVHSGIVEVRPADQPTVVLTQRERWPVAPSSGSPSMTHTIAPPVRETTAADGLACRETRHSKKHPRGAVPGRERERDPDAATPPRAEAVGRDETAEGANKTEAIFNRAWGKLRQGAFADAARDFETVLETSQNGMLTEDATYWHSVALYRAGDRRCAKRAMRAFLERYPASGRRFELSNRLGMWALDEGRLDTAEAYFRAALKSPAPKTRRTAEKGLSKVTQRRSR